MANKWIYRVGLGKDEVSEDALKKSGLKYEHVEVEEALRAHIDETLGKPYKLKTSMREDAPDFFSCSSLPSYLYVFAGVSMPSLVMEKFNFVKKINKEDLRFGDLVFSHHGRLENEPADHMGMYLGDGKILDAVGYWYKGQVYIGDLEGNPSFEKIVGYGRVVDDLKEKRYVIELPEDKPELKEKGALLQYINQYGQRD